MTQAFGEAFDRLRIGRGLSQAELARGLGEYEGNISRWRRGSGIDVVNVRKIADYFGVDRIWLEGLAGYPVSPTASNAQDVDPGKAEWNALYDQMHPETRSTVIPMVRAAANTAGTGTANHAGHPRNGRGRNSGGADIISATRGLVLARAAVALAWICRPLHPLGVPTAATA